LDSTPEVDSGRLQKVNTVLTIKKSVSWEDEGSPQQSISDIFQIRLHGLYSQETTTNKEMNFMKLGKEWNDSGSQDEGIDLGIQNEKIYVLGKEEYGEEYVPKNESGANFQARVQGLYRQSKGPNNEQNFMLMAKKGNVCSCA